VTISGESDAYGERSDMNMGYALLVVTYDEGKATTLMDMELTENKGFLRKKTTIFKIEHVEAISEETAKEIMEAYKEATDKTVLETYRKQFPPT
jgi:hypothetical protein